MPVARVKATVSSLSMVVSVVGSTVKVAVLEPAAKVIVFPVPGVAPV